MFQRTSVARTLLTALLIVGAVVATASAQVTGTVYGTVTDSQGAMTPGATVILINEAQGTKSNPVVTNNEGAYVVPNIPVGVYTVEVSLSGFKSTTRKGITVSRGDRVAVTVITLQPGGVTDVIDVVVEAPIIQSASGERSSTVNRVQLENLPTAAASHTFMNMVTLMPGMGTAANPGTQQRRIGGGGQDNVMLDGLSALDTGNNGVMSGMDLPVDAIAEIKVVTSGYSAEYGRSSGVQVSAVTRSGTNRFHGSVYDYERNSDWNTTDWATQANATATSVRPVSKQRDWGYTIGGPIGKPGAENKLFFFYTQEYRPRQAGGGDTNYRMPTAQERMGDFSKTLDNNGALYNFIYDSASGLPKSQCAPASGNTAAQTAACFHDGGVIGKIPLDRLYGPGLAMLNQYPLPQFDQAAGSSFNYTATQPFRNTLDYTPNIKIDYQMRPSLRLTWRISAQNSRIVAAPGNLPGFTDTIQKFPLSFNTSWAVNYTLTPTTFVEASYGVNQNRLGTPSVASASNRDNNVCADSVTGAVADCTMGSMTFLFPNAGQINTSTYEYGALKTIGVPFLQNDRLNLPPQLSYGNTRIANTPPSINFPGFMNINRIQQTTVSITKVMGNHNGKAGLYFEHSYKAQNTGGQLSFQGVLNTGVDTNNPLDSQMGYSNAALGVFSSFAQGSQFIEGNFVYKNLEWYVQDNWKVNPRLTLDYGVRFAHDGPYTDTFLQVANFFQDRWKPDFAPYLYVAGCPNNVNPCTTANRQAKDPRTGVLLGPGSSTLIDTTIVGSGQFDNGMVRAGNGISDAGYTWPTLAVAPRFGGAYDLNGDQKMVLRGSVGLYFDRPDGNTAFGTVANPPVATGLTKQWGSLKDLAASKLSSGPVPNIVANYYDSAIPKDVQWNAGVQRVLPWASSIDVSYVGHHQYDALAGTQNGNPTNINTIDLGTTLVASGLDPTQQTPTAISSNQLRPFRGYGNINYQWARYHRTYHSLQTTFTRNFRNGFSFGFTDTWTLSDKGNVGMPDVQLRINHNSDASWYIRPDQATAESLFADQGTTTHIAVGNFVYDLPDLHASNPALRAVGAVVNDWQLSGVVHTDSGDPYSLTYSYNSGVTGQQLTGSPNYNARVVLTDLAALGSGCSSNQYAQLGNTVVPATIAGQSTFMSTALAGPQVGSDALESGRFYLTGCKDRRLDLAIQRTIKMGGGRSLVLRADLYNAFNTLIYSGRQTNIQFNSTTDQTVRNSQVLADGSVDPTKLRPNQAGFGAATSARQLRQVQAQVRFLF